MPIQIPGVSGLGNITSIPNYNTIEPYIVFWRFRLELGDVNPSPGVYDWTDFESWVDTVVADDKYFGFQINHSPVTISPAYIFLPPYNVPKVTTTSGQTYPYYLNANFIAIKNAAIDNLRERIRDTWSAARKAKLVFWQSSEGKTGDEGPYGGDVVSVTINGVAQPNPSAYAITDDEWSTYKKTQVWPQFYADLAADIPTCLFLINPSNNGENWAWALTNLPGAGLKIGQPTHNYNNIGEFLYAERCNLITSVLPLNILIGEFESTNDSAWFQISTRQNTFALLLSAMAHGICSFNISYATFNEVINVGNPSDFWMFEFATARMGIRDLSTTNLAWVSLRDCLDGADASRFPVGTYGPIVPTADQAEYNNRYNNIITSGDPQELIDDKLAALLAAYFNNARRLEIDAAFPNATFTAIDTGNDHDAYNQDGGLYMIPDNYGKGITQHDPNGTSEGFHRIGATNQPHGRNCRATDTEMFFSIDGAIVGNNSYNVDFTIWYYDEGSRQWSFNYWDGSAKVSNGTIVNTGTNTWIELSFSLTDFHGGGNIDFTTDFSIKSEDATKTKIELITFERVSQNSVGTSGIYILGNNSGTICGDAEVELFTDGAFGVGEVLYSDEALTTIVTGFDFVLNTANNTIYNLNDTTGVVGASTGLTCSASAVEGDYILGNTLSTVCAGVVVQLYTDGSFAIGSILYSDSGLTTPVTGNDFVVRDINGIIYNLNDITGQIGAATTGICGGGVLTAARLGNDINTVCAQSTTNVYTNGNPQIGSFVYTDINLTIPLTGFDLGVRDSNGKIYALDNATGEILSQVGICGVGIPVDVILGNAIPVICNSSPTTVYAIGNFQIGVFLYEDENITTRVTGFDYVVAPNGIIYNLDDSTGEVLSTTNEICESGVAESFILGFDTVSICESGTNSFLYTDGGFEEGKILYTDINLTNALTSYPYIARLSTNFIYEVDETTGEVLSNTNIKCNMALKTLTISRLRLQPTPSYNIIASIYWRYHLDTTENLVASNIVVDPNGYFSPIITIPNLDTSNDYVVVTAVNEMCETVAEQYFLLRTNISCPEGFTLSEDETYCYIIETIEATPPTSPENAVAASATAYSTCGTYVFEPGYNQNGTGTVNIITSSNSFWINWDGVSAICSDNNTTDGPLNRSGLWAATTLSNQDIGFSICVNLAESKTYYIGIGVDNIGSLKIDGEVIVEQDATALASQFGAASITFKAWLVYPVTISAGLHIIEIIGHNDSSVAAFGAEIYDNTEAELIAATSYGDLNLIFSTKDYVGAPIQYGTDGIGYTCPTGYSLNTCQSPVTCTRIITVPPIIG